uniref:Nuclear condensin complex subunit 3 C-terminal domain-containing protein n=1 Tax=Moniliophthora roreri TaxID=221103 RepID=A0A0W0F282_MONRR
MAQCQSALGQLRRKVMAIFQEAQDISEDNRTRLYASLFTIHSGIVQQIALNRGEEDPIGERAFKNILIEVLSKIIDFKKGASQADRAIKFIGGYIRFMNQKVLDSIGDEEHGEHYDSLNMDTAASRLTESLIHELRSGFGSSINVVRFRVCQLCAEIMFGMGEIDAQILQEMQDALVNRLRDKDISVRVQAAIALCKLVPIVDDLTLIELLKHTMTDPSPDVRHAILATIPVNVTFLPEILERTRDTVDRIRKVVYHEILGKHLGARFGKGPTHPMRLSLDQRVMIVKNGVRDRDQNVQAAACLLMGSWMDKVAEDLADDDEDGEEIDLTAKVKLLELVKVFGVREGEVARMAVQGVMDARPKLIAELEFDAQYWDSVSAEKLLLARAVIDYCTERENHDIREGVLPETPRLCACIEHAHDALVTMMEVGQGEYSVLDDEQRTCLDDDIDECQLCLEEMLTIAVQLEYMPEMSRLMRTMLSSGVLSEKLVSLSLDVLRSLIPDPRDFICTVVEIVHNLRDRDEHSVDDNPEPDPEACLASIAQTPRSSKSKTQENMSPEEQQCADEVEFKCLVLVADLLERVDEILDNNSTLNGVWIELVRPCLERKELEFQEKAIICLGRMCLISKRMAKDRLRFCIHHAQSLDTPEELRLRYIEMIFDILSHYKQSFLAVEGYNVLIEIFGELSRCKSKDDDEKMVTLFQIGSILVEWTNPTRSKVSAKDNKDLHIDVAIMIVKELSKPSCVKDKDGIKTLFQLLPKLNLPKTVDDDKIKHLKVFTDALRSARPPRESRPNRAFKSFEEKLLKTYKGQLQDLDDEEWMNMEEHQEVRDFVTSIAFEDEEQPTRKRKRRVVPKMNVYFLNILYTAMRGKRTAKKQRISYSDSDERDSDSSGPSRRCAEIECGRRMPERATSRIMSLPLWDVEEYEQSTPQTLKEPREVIELLDSDPDDDTRPATNAVSRLYIKDSDSEDEVNYLPVED